MSQVVSQPFWRFRKALKNQRLLTGAITRIAAPTKSVTEESVIKQRITYSNPW